MKDRKILIADDDQQFRELMTDIIHNLSPDEEPTIIYAENGKEAIELFDKSHAEDDKPIDVVICDFVMPEATGSDVIEHIMGTHPVPIVVVSAYQEALDHDVIQERAIYFLRKPFSIKAAHTSLNAAFALKIIPEDTIKAHEALDRLRKLNL